MYFLTLVMIKKASVVPKTRMKARCQKTTKVMMNRSQAYIVRNSENSLPFSSLIISMYLPLSWKSSRKAKTPLSSDLTT